MKQRISDFAGSAFLPVTVISFSSFGFWLLYEDPGAEQGLRLFGMD